MTVDITPTGVVYLVTESAPGVEYPLPFPYMQTTDIKAYISEDGKKTALPEGDRKSTRLNSSHSAKSRMPSSA